MAKAKQTKLVKPEISESIYWVGVLLVFIATWFAYQPAFVNEYAYDDLAYVLENKVLRDFSWNHAWTEFILGNYHPLTALSLKIDHSIGEFNPRTYHIHNVILHALTTLIFIVFTKKLTKSPLIALGAGLLFGVHPLHTESVAWIAERKDVLYTLFFFAGLYTYLLFRESANKNWYLATLVLFIASCLSKGMAVVFPVMMLLCDYLIEKENILLKPASWRLPEKIPFFVLALGFGILAFYVQNEFGSVYNTKYVEMNYGIVDKVFLAIYGFIFYPLKIVWPSGLCAYHPYPPMEDGLLPTYFYLAPLVLLSMIAIVWYFWDKYRMISFAFGFYLMGILPVLQLVPVGENIVAERYAYVSTAGLFILLAWMAHEWEKQKKNPIGYIGLAVISVAFIIVTRERIPDWKNNLSLFRDVAEKYPNSAVAHNNTGYGYEQIKEYRKALDHYFTASSLRANYADVLYNIGSVYGEDLNMLDSGIYFLHKAIAANPKKTEAYNNMGTFYYKKGILDSATHYYELVLEDKPEYPLGWYNLACVYFGQEKFPEALDAYQKCVKYDPGFGEGWLSLGNTWAKLGDTKQQMDCYTKAAQKGSENARNWFRQQNKTW